LLIWNLARRRILEEPETKISEIKDDQDEKALKNHKNHKKRILQTIPIL
jgi:hypothetical protein